MSLQPRRLFALSLVCVCFAQAGCGTIYSDTYSFRRNRFVPPVKSSITPVIPAPPAPGDTTPTNPAPSSAPVTLPPRPVELPGNPMPAH